MPGESTEPSLTGLFMSGSSRDWCQHGVGVVGTGVGVVGTGVRVVGNLGSLADLCALCSGNTFNFHNAQRLSKKRKKNWGDGVDRAALWR